MREMGIKRKQSGVRSIPEKTATGTRYPLRKTVEGPGRGWGDRPFENEAKVYAYNAQGHQLKGRRKKSPPSPPRVRIEKTQKGKRWLSPGEVELHGDVLEVRDESGKIVDSVLLPSPGEEANKEGDKA